MAEPKTGARKGRARKRPRDILADDAVHIMRERCSQGLGFNCTFVDDNMNVLVGLAQRAILAGLASDITPDMQRRMSAAAEPHREAHEKSLGRAIPIATSSLPETPE